MQVKDQKINYSKKYVVKVNGVSSDLEIASEEKNLDVIVDNQLNFENHINNTVKKANSWCNQEKF